MKVGVIRSVYGGYDNVSPLPEQKDVEYDATLVTDKPVVVEGWETLVEPRDWLHPRMAAKVAKCRPDLYAPDADLHVWVDGHIEVTSENFLADLVGQFAGQQGCDVAFMRHPNRGNILDEAKFSVEFVPEKYAGMDLVGQARAHVRDQPKCSWGLWASGLSIRWNSHESKWFGESWLTEQTTWSVQDQISLPYAAAATGNEIFDLRFDGWVNGLWRLQSHGAETQWGSRA